MEFSLFALVKFGQKIHIQALLEKGQIYMNHISEFIKIEDSKLRGDEYEVLLSAEQVYNLEVSLQGRIIGTAGIGKIFIKNNLPVGNIYSMYALSQTPDLSLLKIDERCKEFGDSCLVILNVAEFMKRIEKAVLESGRKLMYSPVHYEDMQTYIGKWSLFKKPIEYNYQKEFRLVVKQEEFIGPVIYEIGPLDDIAIMLESAGISNWKFQAK
jgi:hypothetical protein